MIKTIVTCDNCHNVITDVNQIWSVGITVKNGTSLYNGSYRDFLKAAQWCRPCMVVAHLLPNCDDVEPEKMPETPPTIEELVRDIVREELDNQ